MRYRPLGTTGITVSEIGFGGWGIGGITEGATSYGPTDDRESVRALEEAYNQGINFFDTAGTYGRSEALIGLTFRNRRDKVVIATKVGFIGHTDPQDFSTDNLINSLKRSLKNLRTDYVDLYQLHSPKINEVNLSEISDMLSVLKSRGLIRAFGVSVKSPKDGLIVLQHSSFGSLQVNLSMIDQRAIDNGLLKKAKEQGVGIIGRTPLNFGFLTDNGMTMNLDFGPQDHRSSWSMKQLKTWQKAAQLLSEINPYKNKSLTQFALRFCIDTYGISTVIPGMLTFQDVQDNVATSNLTPLSADTINKVIQINCDNNWFFSQPNK